MLAALALALALGSLPAASARPARLQPRPTPAGGAPIARDLRPLANQNRPIESTLRRYERAVLDPALVATEVRDTGSLRITTENRDFTLHLEPHDLRSPDYQAFETLEDGTTRTLEFTPLNTFRGTVEDIEGAEARFTVDETTVEGIIITPDETYYVEPLSDFAKSANRSELVVYTGADVVDTGEMRCATPLLDEIDRAGQSVAGKSPDATHGANSLQIRIATDADNEYVNAYAGLSQIAAPAFANRAILGILNDVEGVYETQLNLSFAVVAQHTWGTVSDPYTTTNPFDLLDQEIDVWNHNSDLRPIRRNLVHLFTGRTMDGFVAGISNFGVLCDATRGYGISSLVDSEALRTNLTAHEIGHNCGANHPANIGNPPGCDQSIMFPSNTTSTFFCTASRAEIRNHVLDCAQYLGFECTTGEIPSGCWRGEYFDNQTPGGTPEIVRNDGGGNLDFDFGSGSPSDGTTCGVSSDHFSARWTRDVSLVPGTYRFTTTIDGGCELVIDGVTVRDDAPTYAASTRTVDVTFTEEAFHRIVFTYFDDIGPAVAKLSWRKTSGGCRPAVSDGQWKGEYFANETLSGDPTSLQDDGNGDLDFDFGYTSPRPNCGIPADHFSVRWTRNVYFKPGIVTFTVTADDGVRLFVDGGLVLNEFHAAPALGPGIYTVNVRVTMGTHAIRLDYFDRDQRAVAKLKW